ncbi:hypothetical protein ACW4TU_18575 [Streptomyces sp. QTS52]
MSPAEELRHAAFLLRNPLRRPAALGSLDLTEPLAELLETAAEYANVCDTPTHPTHLVRALTVARAINPQEPT